MSGKNSVEKNFDNQKVLEKSGIDIASSGSFEFQNKKLSWIKVKFNGILLDIPLIKNGNEIKRLQKLIEYVGSTQRIHQECRNSQLSLLKSCAPYIEKGQTGVHMFLDDHVGSGDTKLLSSQDIRELIGIGPRGDKEGDAIIDKMRNSGIIAFDPDASNEKNSFAQLLLPFMQSASIQKGLPSQMNTRSTTEKIPTQIARK